MMSTQGEVVNMFSMSVMSSVDKVQRKDTAGV